MKNNRNMASYTITFSLFFSLIIYASSAIDNEYNTAKVPHSVSNRQNAVPVLHVEGTHYEVGFMVGVTFGRIIQNYIEECGPLNAYLRDVYKTSEGKQLYNDNLEAVEKVFPQYLLEIKGMATGANVSFHKLFMLHIDGVIDPSNMADESAGRTGCSTIIINKPNSKQMIGHNEDAMRESLNRFYVINAHVKPGPNESGGRFAAREERWEALTYAATLPGYASGHNHHGLLFTINTIFGKNVTRNRIPRAFLTRALLSSKADIAEVEEILKNRGFGTADAFHINVGLLHDNVSEQRFYSIEVTPSKTALESNVVIESIMPNTTSFHVNRLRMSPDFEESDLSFSIAREERYKQLTKNKPVESLNDVLKVLGDTGDGQIFIDGDDEFAQTINTGVFDCINKMWILWTKNPITNAPVVMLPLKFPDRLIPSSLEETTSKANKWFKVNDGNYELGTTKGGQGYDHCTYSQKCETRRCKCEAAGILCNSKCHNTYL